MSDRFLQSDVGLHDYTRAVLNILEDFAAERARLEDTQRAIMNILSDFTTEKEQLHDTKRAVMNILDDLAIEKDRLVETQDAVVRSEHAIRISLREKEVLLKEVHHRVKNNLQVIASLLNLQARYLRDDAARAMITDSQNRVYSIALVHEKLYRSPNLSHVDFGDYVATLVDNLFYTHGAGSRIAREIDVDGVRLTVDVAIPCGLIVNELVTNSLKHAFKDGRAGTIRVAMAEAGGSHVLIVSDDGIGLPSGFDPKKTQSLGLDLVSTFAEQLDGTVETSGTRGATFRLRFAAERS